MDQNLNRMELLKLMKNGILLNIFSKNNEEVLKQILKSVKIIFNDDKLSKDIENQLPKTCCLII